MTKLDFMCFLQLLVFDVYFSGYGKDERVSIPGRLKYGNTLRNHITCMIYVNTITNTLTQDHVTVYRRKFVVRSTVLRPVAVRRTVLEEKPVPVPLCPPQIPHGLTQDRTWSSAVRGWRITA
jgi:hypothetical protein